MNIKFSTNSDNFSGLKSIANNFINKTHYLLYFVSPEVKLKSEILKKLVIPENNIYCDKFKHLFLDFDTQKDIKYIRFPYNMDSIELLYCYFAKEGTLPNSAVKNLNSSLLQNFDERSLFLINTLLLTFYLKENNFDMARKYIKFSLDYINNNNKDEFESMVIFRLCGEYVKNVKNIFLSGPLYYYSIAAEYATKLKDDISLILIFKDICMCYHENGDTKMSVLYIEKALDISKKLNIKKLNYIVHKNAGIAYTALGKMKLGAEHMEKAVAFSDNFAALPSDEYITFLNNLSYTYFINGDFESALSCSKKAAQNIFKLKSTSRILIHSCSIFHSLSNYLVFYNHLHHSLYFFNLSIDILKLKSSEEEDLNKLTSFYEDLGLLYGFFMNDYKNALHIYNIAKHTCLESRSSFSKAKLLILKAYILSKLNIQKSFECFTKASEVLLGIYKENIIFGLDTICFYVYFSKVYSNHTKDFVETAKKIADECSLVKHYNFYIDYFINDIKNPLGDVNIHFENDPFNLIELLIAERKKSIVNLKKVKDYSLLFDFSEKSGLINSSEKLLKEAYFTFSKYFLSSGFATFCTDENNEFTGENFLEYDFDAPKDDITSTLKKLIVEQCIPKTKNDKGYIILNHSKKNYFFENLRSIIIFYIHDETINCTYYYLIFSSKKNDWYFSDGDARLFTILIKNLYLKYRSVTYTEKIKNNSLIDNFTKFYNAEYLWTELEHLIIEYNAKRDPFCMAMIDIDNFKKLNDSYGHYIGDEGIKFIASILKMTLAGIPNIKIIRYGGDEFVILFEGFRKDNAQKLMERVKEVCKKQYFKFGSVRLKINFSFGIDEYDGTCKTPKDCFVHIDRLMYAYKFKHEKFQGLRIVKNNNS